MSEVVSSAETALPKCITRDPESGRWISLASVGGYGPGVWVDYRARSPSRADSNSGQSHAVQSALIAKSGTQDGRASAFAHDRHIPPSYFQKPDPTEGVS